MQTMVAYVERQCAACSPVDASKQRHRWCRPRHVVLDPHGTIPSGFGEVFWRKLLISIQENYLDLPRLSQVYSLLLEKEDDNDPRLVSFLERCSLKALQAHHVVPIIGYSFARSGEGHDDWLSLEVFSEVLKHHSKPVYIIDPLPTYLSEMLSERIKSKRVYPFTIFWDALARAIVKNPNDLENMYRHYHVELDSMHR